jgi:hypothetical protein
MIEESACNPQKDWPFDSQYRISVAHGAVARDITPERYVFEFRSPAFRTHIADVRFHQYRVHASSRKVIVTVEFSHPAVPERFGRRLSLTMFEKITNSH